MCAWLVLAGCAGGAEAPPATGGSGDLDPSDPSGDPLTGNQSGSVTGWCCECGPTTPLAVDEAGPGGFSARDAFDANGPIVAELAWADGAVDGITVDVALDDESVGNLFWRDANEGDCEDYLSIPVWLHLDTDDGALAETLRTELRAYAPDRRVTGGSTYGDLLGGTLDLARFIPNVVPHNAIVYFTAADEPGGAAGDVTVHPQLGDGTVPDDSTTTSSGSRRAAGSDDPPVIATWSE